MNRDPGGIVIAKGRGSTDPADWYAISTLDDETRLAREAGWGIEP